MQDRTKVYYDGLIGNRIRAFDWYQNQWAWRIQGQPEVFEYLRNG